MLLRLCATVLISSTEIQPYFGLCKPHKGKLCTKKNRIYSVLYMRKEREKGAIGETENVYKTRRKHVKATKMRDYLIVT